MPKRIVVIDPAFIGDAVFDGPLIRALRSAFPSAFLGLVVRPPADAVARRMNGLDRVHVFDKRKTQKGLAGLRAAANELQGENYEAALIPHPSLRSAALASSAKIPLRIGNAPFPARFLLTHKIDARPQHVAARLALLEPFGIESADGSLAGTLRREAPISSRHVGLVLGANWATKKWPLDYFVELAKRLPDDVSIALLGGPEDRAAAEALRAELGDERSIRDATGGTLDALIAEIERCTLVIGGDTGPIHIARAFGIPVCALFGPTPPEAHAFVQVDRVMTVPLDCRPCHPHGPAVCPKGHHKCLRDLGPDRVLGALPL